MSPSAINALEEIFPDNEQILYRKAFILYKLGKTSEAHNVLNDGIKQFPSSAALYHLLGRFNGEEGNAVLALRSFEKALSINPNASDVFLDMGFTFELRATKAKGIDAIVCDLDSGIPFQTGQFDIAILNSVLHSVYRPRFVMEEALRVARRVIVSFPNFGFWLYRGELLLMGRFPKHSLYGYQWYNTRHIHMFSLSNFRDLLKELKVKVVEEKYIGIRNRNKAIGASLAPNLLARVVVSMIEPS